MEPGIKVYTLRELWQESSESHWIPVIGMSMLPLLREGDEILVSHDLSRVIRGDVLVFMKECGLVAHRVVKINMNSNRSPIFTTKGDNRTNFDLPIANSDTLGVVIGIRNNSELDDYSTTMWQMRNKFLGIFHFYLGTIFQVLRIIKHSARKYFN